MSDLEIIILAAGKGTRMGGEKPKVLVELAGRPMLSYILDTVAQVHDKKPIIVVGFQADKVKAAMGPGQRYVFQANQLGTGHAVREALAEVSPSAKYIIVLNGDQPLVGPTTISSLYKAHTAQTSSGQSSTHQPLTISTIRVPDFTDWRMPFYDFGRIIRDEKGLIKKIVEKSEATEQEKAVTEVNPAYYCFDAEWLRDRVKNIDAVNSKGEFYITSLIGMAQAEGAILNSIEIPEHHGLGVNTPEQLTVALKFVEIK
ncbi:MAG: NTP transferase domain-containing protein [bacterium]